MGQVKNKLLDREFMEAFEDPNVQQFFRDKSLREMEEITEEESNN